MSKSNQIQLSDHFTTGRLLKFTASPIIMMIFTSIYTIVDGFFVSNYAGKTAFTALNLIYPYLQMLGCLGFMIGTGGSALVAMTLGTGDEKRANRLFSMLVVATAVLGVLFSAFGLALLEPVALRLGATPELLPSCLTYGRILLTFQTAFMLQYLFQSFFIAAEKPKLGFPVPIRVWLREQKYYDTVKAAFTSPAAKQFFNTDELLSMLDAHFVGKKDNSRKIWTVYMFLVWYEVYFTAA